MMVSMLRRSIRPAGIFSFAALMLLSACGKSTTSSAGGGGGSAGQTGSTTVSTASVPGMGTVLVDARGFTLYVLSTETSGKIMCTGSCATAWPPLLLPGGVTSATAGTGVSASKLGTIKRPDGGTQVTYNGMPLYLFTSDQSAGKATGQGVAGFSVVTVTGSGAPSSSPAGSSSGGANGGGGY
jgi:predicted lipoprotein with Yx(FWY)xxD motif